MTESYHIPAEDDGLRPELSFVDRIIDATLQDYEIALVKEAEETRNPTIIEDYRTQTTDAFGRPDPGLKVNHYCWNLAQRAETYGRAVRLRSWHIVRMIEKVARSMPEVPWTYGLDIQDPFWRDVDEHLLHCIRKWAKEEHGTVLPSEYPVLENKPLEATYLLRQMDPVLLGVPADNDLVEDGATIALTRTHKRYLFNSKTFHDIPKGEYPLRTTYAVSTHLPAPVA